MGAMCQFPKNNNFNHNSREIQISLRLYAAKSLLRMTEIQRTFWTSFVTHSMNPYLASANPIAIIYPAEIALDTLFRKRMNLELIHLLTAGVQATLTKALSALCNYTTIVKRNKACSWLKRHQLRIPRLLFDRKKFSRIAPNNRKKKYKTLRNSMQDSLNNLKTNIYEGPLHEVKRVCSVYFLAQIFWPEPPKMSSRLARDWAALATGIRFLLNKACKKSRIACARSNAELHRLFIRKVNGIQNLKWTSREIQKDIWNDTLHYKDFLRNI